MTSPRFASLSAFLRARVARDQYLGLHLTIGVLVLIVSALIFGHLAEDVVTRDRITVLDVQVAQWFHARATPLFTTILLLFTHLHSTPGILALTALLAIYWARLKAWDWLLTLVLTVPVGMLLNVLLKNIFQRVRPVFDVPLVTLNTYSFPSGHTAAATLLYGVLAAWLISRQPAWPWRVFIALLAVLMVALVALSRVYLGAHYLSDVLAAMAASTCWLTFSLTAVDTSRRRRRLQQFKA